MPPVIPGLPPSISGAMASPADVVVLALEPGVVLDASPLVRAAASFVLVLVFGGAVLYRFEEFVTESVESSMERPLVSTLYGVAGLAAVVYIGFYAYTQATTFGGTAADVTMVAIMVIVSTLSAIGFTVVGVRLAEAADERRPWAGLLVGAAVSAVAWLSPFLVPALVIWIAIAGTGIGGPTRNWILASQSVETESQSG